MTPGARAGAAIELLDEVIGSARAGGPAADALVARYFAKRRYAGSKDRRAVRELVYRAIRASGAPPVDGRAALLAVAAVDESVGAAFDGSPHAPAPVAAGELSVASDPLPGWLRDRFDPLVGEGERPALLSRAPLDLRANRLRAERGAALAELAGEGAEPSPLSLLGVRLPGGTKVDGLPAWREGRVEVQDEGSQLVSLACGARPGMTAVDLCAGAGGKTLALAAEMANEGRIVAADANRDRLGKLPPRAARAGATIAEPRLLDPHREAEMMADLAGVADLVLVDAPCSGSGTWRRNPETRWWLTPDRLAALVALQARLLGVAAGLVRPGGTLVYVVCSLLAEEGRHQATAFARGRSAFVQLDPGMEAGRSAGPGRLLTPAHDRTDGFFIARWTAA
ncbi:MAG: Sun protein [uncultured Sphingomonadaceae bacterium]|uniref:Sun protein n=1 Tax=uncultured Sphingomonadaceae bacterium TaxID=169976 RepID=A0A6J4TEK5_9SPHN|nr:MAG: Sun protein [uncultured Sphingomonadaceae bacterium]